MVVKKISLIIKKQFYFQIFFSTQIRLKKYEKAYFTAFFSSFSQSKIPNKPKTKLYLKDIGDNS